MLRGHITRHSLSFLTLLVYQYTLQPLWISGHDYVQSLVCCLTRGPPWWGIDLTERAFPSISCWLPTLQSICLIYCGIPLPIHSNQDKTSQTMYQPDFDQTRFIKKFRPPQSTTTLCQNTRTLWYFNPSYLHSTAPRQPAQQGRSTEDHDPLRFICTNCYK